MIKSCARQKHGVVLGKLYTVLEFDLHPMSRMSMHLKISQVFSILAGLGD